MNRHKYFYSEFLKNNKVIRYCFLDGKRVSYKKYISVISHDMLVAHFNTQFKNIKFI